MKMVAITHPGQEFVYSRKSAHKVPTSSAGEICAALNETRHGLKDGEIWHVYDMGSYEADYTAAGAQYFGRRNGYLYERRVAAW